MNVISALVPLLLTSTPVVAAPVADPAGAPQVVAPPAVSPPADVEAAGRGPVAPATAEPAAPAEPAVPPDVRQVVLWSGARLCGVIVQSDQSSLRLRNALGEIQYVRRGDVAQMHTGARAMKGCRALYATQAEQGAPAEPARPQAAVHVGYPWGVPIMQSVVLALTPASSPARVQMGLIGRSLVVGRLGLSLVGPKVAAQGTGWAFDLPVLVGLGLIDGEPDLLDMTASLDSTYWLSQSLGASVRATLGGMYHFESHEMVSFQDERPVYFQLSFGLAFR